MGSLWWCVNLREALHESYLRKAHRDKRLVDLPRQTTSTSPEVQSTSAWNMDTRNLTATEQIVRIPAEDAAERTTSRSPAGRWTRSAICALKLSN